MFNAMELAKHSQELMERWGHLVEPITKGDELHAADPARAQFVAQLLENQKAEERRSPTLEAVDQLTTTLPMSVFPSQYAFPVITQAYRDLIATELVTVQAINAPTARVLYKDFQRSNSGSPVSLTHTGSYGATAEAAVPALGRMHLKFVELSTEKYSFRVAYSQELLEDAAVYGINVQREVIDALSAEIQGELDELILTDLVNGATGPTFTWDSAGFVGGSYGYNINEYRKTIWHQVIDARNAIYNSVYQNPNFIVVGTDVAGILERLETFQHTPGLMDTVNGMGVLRSGTLDNQFKVYKTPLSVMKGKMLVGVTGMAYIWAPYVPLSLGPVIPSNTQEWEQSIRTRFARKMVRPQSLSVINVI